MQCIEAALDTHSAPPGDVSVLLTDDIEMRELNMRFRGVDSATDVLTFPAPPTAIGHLGEIAVSLDFAAKQAESRGVSVEDEAAMLVIHGALHLAGFDDGTESERSDMVLQMNKIATICGVPTDEKWHSVPHGVED